jgi:hypothetical protein
VHEIVHRQLCGEVVTHIAVRECYTSATWKLHVGLAYASLELVIGQAHLTKSQETPSTGETLLAIDDPSDDRPRLGSMTSNYHNYTVIFML